MKKQILSCLFILFVLCSVSCGSYKRSSTETDLQQTTTNWQKKQNNAIVLETVQTTLESYEPLKLEGSLQPPPKKWVLQQTKTTKTVDKGTVETQSNADTSLKVDDKSKENPWQPPWYTSGLVVLVLLVAYKVFKTKFQIVKKT